MTILITQPLKVSVFDCALFTETKGEFKYISPATLKININNLTGHTAFIKDEFDWQLTITDEEGFDTTIQPNESIGGGPFACISWDLSGWIGGCQYTFEITSSTIIPNCVALGVTDVNCPPTTPVPTTPVPTGPP